MLSSVACLYCIGVPAAHNAPVLASAGCWQWASELFDKTVTPEVNWSSILAGPWVIQEMWARNATSWKDQDRPQLCSGFEEDTSSVFCSGSPAASGRFLYLQCSRSTSLFSGSSSRPALSSDCSPFHKHFNSGCFVEVFLLF